MGNLVLHGGNVEKDLEFKTSEINHMRRLLAWMRCEYMLDEHMQAGYALGTKEMLDAGHISEKQAVAHLQGCADSINRVPKYVQQAVKMLTKAVNEHDRRMGIVDGEVMKNRLE